MIEQGFVYTPGSVDSAAITDGINVCPKCEWLQQRYDVPNLVPFLFIEGQIPNSRTVIVIDPDFKSIANLIGLNQHFETRIPVTLHILNHFQIKIIVLLRCPK